MSELRPNHFSSNRKLFFQKVHLYQLDCLVFRTFSTDGSNLSAIEFFKLCKILKVYPVITTFDYLKKIVLKSPEFWSSKKDHSNGMNEIISTNFNFKDFFKAFKVSSHQYQFVQIIAKIGYRNIDDSNQVKFQMLLQYIKKQFLSFLNKGDRLAETQSETRSVKDQSSTHYQNMLKHQYSYSSQNAPQTASQQRGVSSPQNQYQDGSNISQTPTQIDNLNQERKLINGDVTEAYTVSQLSNDYRTLLSQNMNTGQYVLNSQQWRTCSSEVKSDISSRAFSSAVRTSQNKAKGGIIIPKGQLKKKFKQNPPMSINNFIQRGNNFKSVTHKDMIQQQKSLTAERKSVGQVQYTQIKLKETRNKSPQLSQSLQTNQLLSNNEGQEHESQSFVQPQYQTLQLNADNVNKLNQSAIVNPATEVKQDFRIRKFSRSISRGSRSSSLSSARKENEDEVQIQSSSQTIESPEKHQDNAITINDINIQDYSKKTISQSFKKREDNLLTEKYKKERDQLAVALRAVKRSFMEFAKNYQLYNFKTSILKSEGGGDTGNSYLEEIQVSLMQKDQRITALEDEVSKLRQREQDLLNQLQLREAYND